MDIQVNNYIVRSNRIVIVVTNSVDRRSNKCIDYCHFIQYFKNSDFKIK